MSWVGQVRGNEWYECVILKDSINNLVIAGCSVLCRLFGCMFFGFWFFLGSMVMYLCMSHNIFVSKFWGGGCRELVSCVRVLWEN